jgi:hypothetical protein
VAVLAWDFTYSGYGTSLSFDTYFNILFYLLAGIIIISRKYVWLILVTVFASINRETSGLIAVILAVSTTRIGPKPIFNWRVLAIAGICMFPFVAEYLGLRLYFGPRKFSDPLGHSMGWDVLRYNLTDRYTYFSAFATFSFLPLLALVQWRKWPEILHSFFWAIVPMWLLIIPLFGKLAEARLLLVPYIIVFLPAAFIVIQGESHESI